MFSRKSIFSSKIKERRGIRRHHLISCYIFSSLLQILTGIASAAAGAAALQSADASEILAALDDVAAPKME